MKHWDHQVDAKNLNCPMPLLKMKQVLNKAQVGETIMVMATDPASERDFKSYINMTQHQLEMTLDDNLYCYWITKF